MRKNINYPTLWQPTMIKGIPRDYAIFVFIIFALSNIFLTLLGVGNLFWGFGIAFIFFVYGYFRAKSDPEFLLIYVVKYFKIKKTKSGRKGNIYYA